MTNERTDNRVCTARSACSSVVSLLAMFVFGFAARTPVRRVLRDHRLRRPNECRGGRSGERSRPTRAASSAWSSSRRVRLRAVGFRPPTEPPRSAPGPALFATFTAKNLTDAAQVAQAVPSVAPGRGGGAFSQAGVLLLHEPGVRSERGAARCRSQFMRRSASCRHIDTYQLAITFYDRFAVGK